MIAQDFACRFCKRTFETMVPSGAETAPCKCGKQAVLVFLPRRERPENAARFNPVVVFRKPDGTYIFPGRSNESAPKGTERVELRSLSQVQRFEREENARLKQVHQESMARRDAYYQAEKRERREQLRAMLPGMSVRGRQFAAVAIAESDACESASSKAARFDPGFRVSVFHDDQSNRPVFRDVDTDWRARRD